jgi:hypothetical protein
VLLDKSGAKDWENLTWPEKEGVIQVGKENIWAKEKIPNYSCTWSSVRPTCASDRARSRQQRYLFARQI